MNILMTGLYISTTSVIVSCSHATDNNTSKADSTKSAKNDTLLVKDVKDEPALSLINFLKFYMTDDSVHYYSNRMVTPLDAYSLSKTKPDTTYQVDLNACDKYLLSLNKNSFLSDYYIKNEKKYFLEYYNDFIKEPQKILGPPMNFDYDRVFEGQVTPSNISELENYHVVTNKISGDTGFVLLAESGGEYTLIKKSEHWQLLSTGRNINH